MQVSAMFYFMTKEWSYIMIIPLIFNVTVIVSFIFIPEPFKFLVSKHKFKEASIALNTIC
jgi:membrane protein YdbS with pleckstrin-like domain